ncbi:nicotinate phosphoribosyltransferase [Rhizobium binae]|nr:nicotinate phosphoribosyltransferase [Rhizobium binae]
MPASPLFADLYEFTMLDAYHALGMDQTSVFSLFVRKLPSNRNFLIACGIESLIDDIEALRFSDEDVDYLSSLMRFRPEFLSWLKSFRFTGNIYAMPEGTPFFGNEPILEVVAPIAEAQLLETIILNQVGFQTMIASKTARVVAAGQGRVVVDFGGRRAHGTDAAIKGARAAFIAGAAATSNVEAGRLYGIPVTGTVAHSFVEAFETELEAFRKFTQLFPETTLLVDTYDTLAGVSNVVALARQLGATFKVQAIRLDSGDLLQLASGARQILDDAGLGNVRIFASGGLDEWKIARLLREGAPIDAFGVGTEMIVSSDAPAFDIAYKLCEYDGVGRMKLSAGKRNLPGRKQVFRHFVNGQATGDTISRAAEERLGDRPLLRLMVSSGRRRTVAPELSEIRSASKAWIAELPEPIRLVEPTPCPFFVDVSPALNAHEAYTRNLARQAGGSSPRILF